MRLLLASLLLGCLAAFAAGEASDAAALPEQYYGKFVLDHSENFDAYLEAKGYGWFTRQLITFAKFEKVFKKATGNAFDYDNLTTKKNVHYKNVVLGTEFQGEGLDSTQHKITFYMKGGKLYEKHNPLVVSGDSMDEEYEYYFEGEFLVVKMNAGSVVAKRFYKLEKQ